MKVSQDLCFYWMFWWTNHMLGTRTIWLQEWRNKTLSLTISVSYTCDWAFERTFCLCICRCLTWFVPQQISFLGNGQNSESVKMPKEKMCFLDETRVPLIFFRKRFIRQDRNVRTGCDCLFEPDLWPFSLSSGSWQLKVGSPPRGVEKEVCSTEASWNRDLHGCFVIQSVTKVVFCQ